MTCAFLITTVRNALLLLIIFVAMSTAARAQTKQPGTTSTGKPMIANIKNGDIYSGCGCYFSYSSEAKKRFPKFVFVSDDDKQAWMNLDGKDIKLALTHRTTPKVIKIGSRLTRTYSGNGYAVSVVYITTKMCAPNDEACEVTDYNATITVSKGARKQTVKLKGGCGC